MAWYVRKVLLHSLHQWFPIFRDICWLLVKMRSLFNQTIPAFFINNLNFFIKIFNRNEILLKNSKNMKRWNLNNLFYWLPLYVWAKNMLHESKKFLILNLFLSYKIILTNKDQNSSKTQPNKYISSLVLLFMYNYSHSAGSYWMVVSHSFIIALRVVRYFINIMKFCTKIFKLNLYKKYNIIT